MTRQKKRHIAKSFSSPSNQPVERFLVDTWKVILMLWWGRLKANFSISHIFNNSVASCSRSWDCTFDNSRCSSCAQISNQSEKKSGSIFIHPSNLKVKKKEVIIHLCQKFSSVSTTSNISTSCGVLLVEKNQHFIWKVRGGRLPDDGNSFGQSWANLTGIWSLRQVTYWPTRAAPAPRSVLCGSP